MARTILQRGSLSWHLAHLQPGDVHLVADNGKGTAQHQNLATTTNRLEKRMRGVRYEVRTCYGYNARVTMLPGTAFRFYKIERTK